MMLLQETKKMLVGMKRLNVAGTFTGMFFAWSSSQVIQKIWIPAETARPKPVIIVMWHYLLVVLYKECSLYTLLIKTSPNTHMLFFCCRFYKCFKVIVIVTWQIDSGGTSSSSDEALPTHNSIQLQECIDSLREIVGADVPREELLRISLAADCDLNRAINFFFA